MTKSLLKISEAASIGLHSMMELAKNNGKLLSVKEISTKLDVSANHLSKVLQRLNKAGYIDSIKGQNGGFRLAINAEKITFLEIFELLDGKIVDCGCLLSKKVCNNCLFGDLILSVNRQVRDRLANIKLSDIKKSN